MNTRTLVGLGIALFAAGSAAQAQGGMPARLAGIETQLAGVEQRLTSVEQAIELLTGPAGVTRDSISGSPTVATYRDVRSVDGQCDRMQRTLSVTSETTFEIREIFTNSFDGQQATIAGCTSNVRGYAVVDDELRMVTRQNLGPGEVVYSNVTFTPGMIIYRPTMVPGESYAVLSRLSITTPYGYTGENTDIYMASYHGVADQDVALAGDYHGCVAFENGQGDAAYRHLVIACEGVGNVVIQESGEVSYGDGTTSKYNRIWIRD